MLILTQIGARFVPNVPQAQKSFWMHPMELLGEWAMSNLVSIHLDTVLVSVQDRCTVCARRTIGSKMFQTQPVLLLGDDGQVEARFGAFGASANLDARLVHGLYRTYHRLGNRFGCTRWFS